MNEKEIKEFKEGLARSHGMSVSTSIRAPFKPSLTREFTAAKGIYYSID